MYHQRDRSIAPLRSAHPDLAAALKECRRAFLSVAIFSGVVNLLMLAGPLYMLQVYDRVLASRSVPTLIALSLFLLVAYAFQGGLDVDPLAARGPDRLDARSASRALRARRIDPACEPEPQRDRSASAGARPRPDPRIPDRPGTDRHRRPAVDADLSRHLLPDPSMARRGALWAARSSCWSSRS